MEQLELNGTWSVRMRGGKDALPARVPGCVHLDLLAAGRIPDPFFRDNENDLQWIGEVDWIYTREVNAPAALLDHDRVLLVCEGLDTLATLELNGVRLGETNNMFRTYEFDVKDALRPGANTLRIAFASTIPTPPDPNPLPADDPRARHRFKPFARRHLRKEPCNYGWDWGPTLVTCGVWRPIRLVAFDVARLTDVAIRQRHASKSVRLEISVAIEPVRAAALKARVTLSRDGRELARKITDVRRGAGAVSLIVRQPELWWPNGMGDQPLYDVAVELLDAGGSVLDTQRKRIGLRTLNVRRRKDRWGESFEFVVNRVPFFAKGADWIPADVFAPRLTRDDYARLLGDAAAVHMNMLRVWGGGIYEDDAFYAICDELGLCVWQDMMFSCATYPTFDEGWMANVEAEARDNIRRLRHHPAIALWCGNNEVEFSVFVGDQWTEDRMSWESYGRLFDELLPRVAKELAPDIDYWPGSPHTPVGDRAKTEDPHSGDAHLWDVWHGRQPFEWYHGAFHRFVSEFGFQSFPEPKTVRGYTLPADRNLVSRIMEHHQRSYIGNTAIMQYLLDWFRLPGDFDSQLWLSQILQGLGIRFGVEHWRRNMPRCMGALYWQLNDCWPVASWASIDYHGRWKALHYMARRFFAPLLVSGVPDVQRRKVDLHVASDRGEAVDGRLRWRVTTVGGRTLEEAERAIRIAPRKSTPCGALALAGPLAQHPARDLIVWLALDVDGAVVSENTVLLARPKHMDLERPAFQTRVRPLKDGTFSVRVKSDKPALWVWLELRRDDARFSDNFFDLPAGGAREIVIRPARKLSREALERQLSIRSLVDTY
ncbi:MAG TPA: glycoside hydrolase family 2 protein [Candidatus Sumerlaeota bacterium]|nr:glycoside hydrolase family 2 protein [Candidatus Sumerlaeota bacterium]